jgi:hypothetical protein
MGTRVTWLGRFVRGRRLDRNPLRRATDRIETVVLAVLMITFLAGAPFAALATGAWTHGIAQRTQLSQLTSRFQVQAVVMKVTELSTVGFALDGQAEARWRAPDGREVTGEVAVPPGTAVGRTIQVWTDRAGAVTNAPLVDSQVTNQTVLGEALGVIVTGGVLTLAGELVLWTLNKRRMAAWDADWHATGPRWTTRALRQAATVCPEPGGSAAEGPARSGHMAMTPRWAAAKDSRCKGRRE